ncbi:MAG TPA: hypothetical protein VI997_10855 [Candidatus Thermoplasmatota archaeon]|nr:hypothetical protein [Candidatus Thermoplasmatota archaeon]
MPGAVTHALFPLLPLLAFTRFPRRLVVALLPLALVQDLDYVVGPHRALLHNVFIAGAPLVLWTIASRVARLAPHRDAFAVAGAYLGTHLAMDLFAGGFVPFWPLVDVTWLVDLTIDVDTSTNRPLVYFDYGAAPGIPTVSRVYAFLTWTEAAILGGLAAFAAAFAFARARRRAGKHPASRER